MSAIASEVSTLDMTDEYRRAGRESAMTNRERQVYT